MTGKRNMCDRCYTSAELLKRKQRDKKQREADRKKKIRAAKAESIIRLTEVLDNVFSRFIRLRDTDADGVGYCIDCNSRVAWDKIDCGHFIVRKYKSTRWDEQNCAAQWSYCNGPLSGRQFEFGKGIDLKYGAGTAEAILLRSKEEKKWSTDELKSLIAYYTEEVSALLATKNFLPWKK
jgi:hypothetical protein